jgi:hypothetical protein
MECGVAMIRGGYNAGIKKKRKILWFFAHLFVTLPAEIKLYDYECSINEQSLGLSPGTFADCQQSQVAGRTSDRG